MSDLTMAAHARAIARQARTLELETGDPSNPFRPGSVTDLNRLVVQLADIVAELAATQAGPNGNDSMAFHSFREAYDWIAEPDPLADIMTAIETGCDMVTYSLRLQSNAQQTVDAMHAAVALLRETVMRYTGPAATVDARSLETGEPVPVSVTVHKVADPLDEWRTGVHIAEGMTVRVIGADGSTRVGTVGEMVEADGLTNWTLIPDDEPDPLDEDDHRPRHFPDGEHLRRYACGHWHMAIRDRCNEPDHGDGYTIAWWDEPLTFCDCP